jgi:GntR family transcriptional repressor for pyruvate dehydrogenase complex
MIWSFGGNAVMQRFALALYNMGLDVRRRATQDPVLIRQSTQDHIRIVAAIAARDGERAFREMLVHLDHIEETTRRAMTERADAVTVKPALGARGRRSS